MAWTAGSFPDNAVGRLTTLLDAVLLANANWTIYDTLAANSRVYRCLDAAENCEFYVLVNNVGFAGVGTIELWEGWDAVGDVGVGASLTVVGTSGTLKMTYGAGGYGISVRDHCFIWQDYVGNRGNFIGQPRRKDTSLNIVVFIGPGDTPGINPLGVPGAVVANAWGSLFDELGNKVALGFSMSGGGATSIVKTITGALELKETPLVNLTTKLILGELEGVASYGAATTAGIVTGDTCVIAGVTWKAIYATNLSFVEQA